MTRPKHVKLHAPGVQFSTRRACCTTLLARAPDDRCGHHVRLLRRPIDRLLEFSDSRSVDCVAGPDDAGASEAAKRSGPQRRLLPSRGPGFATLPSIRNGRRCSARPWKAHSERHISSSAPATEKEKRSRGGGREPAGITQSGTLALHTPVEASEASRGRDLAAALRTGQIPGGTLHCGPLGACAARSPRHLATPVPAGLIRGGTLNDSPIEAGGARVAGCAAGLPAGRCPFWGGCGGGPAAATTRVAYLCSQLANCHW